MSCRPIGVDEIASRWSKSLKDLPELTLSCKEFKTQKTPISRKRISLILHLQLIFWSRGVSFVNVLPELRLMPDRSKEINSSSMQLFIDAKASADSATKTYVSVINRSNNESRPTAD